MQTNDGKYHEKCSAVICIIILTVMMLDTCQGSIHFAAINNDLCINQPVEYQCTVTGSGLQALTWRVYTDDGTQITGSPHNYLSSNIGTSVPIGGVFTVEQISQSPLVSNISFTVQSSINGYTIICEDSGTLNNENFTINVQDDPGDVIIHTFTNSSVNISWTESSSPCVTGYRYNISSSALEENIIMESNISNSVMVEGLVPSDEQYCVVVTAIDQYNYNLQSNKSCFIFNYPNSVKFNDIVVNKDLTSVTVMWVEPHFTIFQDMPPSFTTPDLISYTAVLIGQEGVASYISPYLPPSITNYTFTGVSSGLTYTIIVNAINGIGSSYNSTIIAVPSHTTSDGSSVPSSSVIISVTSTFSASQSTSILSTTIDLTTSHSATPVTTESSNKPVNDEDIVVAIAVGVVVLILFIALVISIVFVVVLFLYYWWKNTNELAAA